LHGHGKTTPPHVSPTPSIPPPGALAFQPGPCPTSSLVMGWCVVRNISCISPFQRKNVCLLYKRKSLDTLAEEMQNISVRFGQLHVEYLPVQCCVVECPCSFLACIVAFQGVAAPPPCVPRVLGENRLVSLLYHRVWSLASLSVYACLAFCDFKQPSKPWSNEKRKTYYPHHDAPTK
jgi:hypothetical protein